MYRVYLKHSFQHREHLTKSTYLTYFMHYFCDVFLEKLSTILICFSRKVRDYYS